MAGASGGVAADCVGRLTELASIAAAIDAAVAGRPSVLWISGAAGTGKTTLVRTALSRLPPGVSTLRAQADELAREVPYELTRQLGAQRRDGGFAVGQELLGIWSRHQDLGPLVVVVEDLHWSDQDSSDALLSAARRTEQDRVVVIVTNRNRPAGGWERLVRDDHCQELPLEVFDSDEVRALAERQGVFLTPRQAERLTRHTGGLPLWVRTLLAELTPAELTAQGDLPAPRSLASSVTARLSEVSPAGRDLASALAVVNQRTSLAAVGRVAGLQDPSGALEPLLATGFVRWEPRELGAPVEFAHPLYRVAIYEDLAPTRRRDLHRVAAQILSPAVALAHRVAGADGVDEKLADELELAADTAWAAGALPLAARNLLWAATVCGSTERAERCVAKAALAFQDTAQPNRAAALREQVERASPSALRDLVLGLADWESGNATAAEAWLRRATADRPIDQVVVRAWAQLAELHVLSGRPVEAIEAAEVALAHAEQGSSAQRVAREHRGLGEFMLRGPDAGVAWLNRWLPAEPDQVPAAEVDLLVMRATLGYYGGRMTSCLADLRTVLRHASGGKVPVQLARSHFLTASALTQLGEWDEALVHARTATSLADDDHLVHMACQCHSALAILLAYRGEWNAAADHVKRAGRVDGIQDHPEAPMARLATGALAWAQGKPDVVIQALTPIAASPPAGNALLLFWTMLIDGLLEAGETGEAATQIGRLADTISALDATFGCRLLRLEARLAAARGQPDEASRMFGAALEARSVDDPHLERALLHHDYGRLLLARRDRRHGIDQLRIARRMLAAVGAAPFVARVDADLSGAGLPSPTSSPSSVLELTDRERDVAVLVAQGRSNPEAAAALFVSRKAVEFHLRNIYGKLGISSRRELRDVFPHDPTRIPEQGGAVDIRDIVGPEIPDSQQQSNSERHQR